MLRDTLTWRDLALRSGTGGDTFSSLNITSLPSSDERHLVRRLPGLRLVVVAVSSLLAVTLLSPAAHAAPQAPRAVTPVASVDLARYQGAGRQLAAIPQPCQAACARNDGANYTVLGNGEVKVLNSCTRADGATFSLEGRARPSVPGSTSRLEVSFLPTADGGWNFDNPGTYWVLGLDRDYQWAVVGDPDRRSGFVLSRTTTPTARQVVGILGALLRNGYDPCRFRITAQDGGAPMALGPC